MHKATHTAIGFLIALAVTTACGRRSSPTGASTGEGASSIRSLGLPTAANSTPVLAASGDWVVAVWTASEHERTDIYAATSKDGAVQFGAPVRVNDVEGEAHVYGEDPPRVAIVPSAALSPSAVPEIVVTWPSDRTKHLGMRSARSLDGGRTFLPSTSVGDEAIVAERGFQSVTVGPDRIVHAAWLDGRGDPGTPHHANAGTDYDPMHLMFANGTADGRWKVEHRLATNVCGCCKTAIATAADGRIFVAFRNIYPGSLRDISFTMSHDRGQTFAPPVRISEDHWMLDGCPDDGPTMAVDRDGVVHVVWPTLVQGEQPAISLFHASSRDGATFTTRQRIETLGTPKPSHPQLVADSCGSLTLVWDETQGSTRRAMMRQLTPLPSGDVRLGALHVVSGPHSAVYPVVAPMLTGVVAAWTDIDRTKDDRSDIALRHIPLDASCEVPADAATLLSISNNATATAVPVKRYTLNGRVVSLDAATKTLTVDQEAIPGFMGAMTMPYPVRDSQVLEHFSKGQQITATVVRAGDDYWLENVGPRAR